MEIPLTSHSNLPDGVPLIASFHDDRNRLSYYHPILRETEDVQTPRTRFFPVEGSSTSFLDVEYREITKFMQELGETNAFVRSDYSSGKYDGDNGSRITSQDPYDIETVVLELFRQLSRGKRHIGGRIAVREWIPHDREVRYFIRNGRILYRGSLDDGESFPDEQAQQISRVFETFSWSVDFIRHSLTGRWYCTDMGLDGLYYSKAESEWIAISEHLDASKSPKQHASEMPDPGRFTYLR